MQAEEIQISFVKETVAIVISFFSLFFFSMLIGLCCGLIFSYLFKILELNKIPWIEIGLFMLASYFPYILAEGMGCSGLLSILMMAIIMRNYCFHSLSPVSSISIEFLVEMLCNMCENFLFCYLGISIPITITNAKLSLIIVGIIALLISRIISVWLTATIINLTKSAWKHIPFTYTIVMTWGGLWGAVAFYLALKMNSEYKNLIITTTMSLIVFTIIGLGGTTKPVIWLLVTYFPHHHLLEEEDEERISKNSKESSNQLSNPANYDWDERLSIGVVTKLEHFDNQFLKNFFVKQGQPKNYKDGQWVNLDEGNYEFGPEDFYMLDNNEPVEKAHL